MERKEIFRSAMLAIAMFVLVYGQAQVTIEQNFPANPGQDYVGWDNTTTVPLMIRHDANQPIQWFTDSIHRMQLWETQSNTINGFINRKQDGFLGISDVSTFFAPTAVGPFSRIHLVDAENADTSNPINFAQVLGYRPWMRNGITMTGNSDQCYMGAKYQGNDTSDIVLQWSDNPDDAIYGTDRLRFLFTNRHNAAHTYGARSEEGLESFRVFVPNDTTANVGIGDFHRASVQTSSLVDPTERLDVLDGRVRVRDLPMDPEGSSLQKYLVVDDLDSTSGEFGVVKWRTLPPSATSDCDWFQDANNNVITAVGGPNSNPCPDVDNKVSIGTYSVDGKLTVKGTPQANGGKGIVAEMFLDNAVGGAAGYGMLSKCIPAWQATGLSTHYGLWALGEGGTGENYGVLGKAVGLSGSTGYNYGVLGFGTGSGTSYGVKGISNGSGTNFGVFAEVNSASTTVDYGVYGIVTGGDTSDWAGWFQGKVFATTYVTSDESLKQNIEDLSMEEATDVLSALNIHTYNYRTEEYAEMNLPAGTQAGVLAHELEAVLPHLVTGAVQPEMIDSAGNVTQPSVAFRAVNYTGLIPYLVAGFQSANTRAAELEGQLAAQNERLDQLESMLLDCCNRSTPDGDRSMEQEQELLNERFNERSMQVVPNPFQSETTIHYNLEKGGRVQLMANSADGKQLQVLSDNTSEAGVYQFNWSTGDLAAGMYYVTLLLDGEPITKRAVKIDR
jgi:hypothetical protein